LWAISDNGPQMRSHTTREFLAGVAIAQQFGRPHTPEDQAWIETLFGHVTGEWPHLEKIRVRCVRTPVGVGDPLRRLKVTAAL
ncbi:MAG: DDE-type integrase/transposase/recombinase, partial [Pseudonocardia sp.]|nr:DDE-type integrase/transposase/recombinase [Pseudonocardia sp.]